jgi:hypothetical protein
LDTGQARVNYYHRPERLLHPPNDEPQPERDDDDSGDSPPLDPIADGGCREPQPIDPVRNDDADPPDEPTTGEPDSDAGESLPPEPIGDGGCGEPEPLGPVGNDDADQPGGPAPPDDQAA